MSRWITGPESRSKVHQLRREVDAILVGAGTVRTDDPSLDVRLEESSDRHPRRIVLDSKTSLDLGHKVFRPDGRAIWVTGQEPTLRREAEEQGIEVMCYPASSEIPLDRLMHDLYQRGILHVMSESGGTVNESLFRQGLVQEVWTFVAPVIVGGAEATTMCDGVGVADLAIATKLKWLDVQRFGTDVWLRARVVGGG